tara:strand:- start:230 stop:478 length:249 start_codon:yes stop_codon:yes gene_type:complete
LKGVKMSIVDKRELTTMEKVWIEVALKNLLKGKNKNKVKWKLLKQITDERLCCSGLQIDVLENLNRNWDNLNKVKIIPFKEE